MVFGESRASHFVPCSAVAMIDALFIRYLLAHWPSSRIERSCNCPIGQIQVLGKATEQNPGKMTAVLACWMAEGRLTMIVVLKITFVGIAVFFFVTSIAEMLVVHEERRWERRERKTKSE